MSIHQRIPAGKPRVALVANEAKAERAARYDRRRADEERAAAAPVGWISEAYGAGRDETIKALYRTIRAELGGRGA